MHGEKSPYIIAEMACSHDGSVELGKTIIRAAAEAGANAIQLQIWLAEDMMVPQHPDFPTLQNLELTRDQWRELNDEARASVGLERIACVYELKSVDFAEDIEVDAYKIHSADLSNPLLVRRVAQTGKRIDLSVGASSQEEIRKAIGWIRGEGNENIWLMQGFQLFPTPTDLVHLRYLKTLGEAFGLPVGYQDHSSPESPASTLLPAAALGVGVRILEKHITHDRSKKGADHQAALNPDEFVAFVAEMREVVTALGSPEPRPFSPEEEQYRIYAKKSLVAARDLPQGHTLEPPDLLFMRAESLGVPPDRIDELTGRSLKRELKAYDLVTHEDLA